MTCPQICRVTGIVRRETCRIRWRDYGLADFFDIRASLWAVPTARALHVDCLWRAAQVKVVQYKLRPTWYVSFFILQMRNCEQALRAKIENYPNPPFKIKLSVISRPRPHFAVALPRTIFNFWAQEGEFWCILGAICCCSIEWKLVRPQSGMH